MFSGYFGFLPSTKNQHFQIPIRPGHAWTEDPHENLLARADLTSSIKIEIFNIWVWDHHFKVRQRGRGGPGAKIEIRISMVHQVDLPSIVLSYAVTAESQRIRSYYQ